MSARAWAWSLTLSAALWAVIATTIVLILREIV